MASEAACISVKDGEEIKQLLDSRFPHPELRGGTRPVKHSFSPRQMITLEAICDTIVPSIPAQAAAPQQNPDVEKFLGLSASQAGVVTEVAGMISAWATKQQFVLVYVALLMLTTRLGTFLLSGFSSITNEFPYFQPFAALSIQRRENILLGWSRSIFPKLQMFFKLFKCYTVFKYYSRADEKGRNPAWEAIGYQIPKLVLDHEEPLPNPLDHRLVDAKAPDFQTRLAELGCSMLTNVDHLKQHSLRQQQQNLSGRTDEFGIKCDVVIVGSGSGGGVLAAKLSQQGFKVVVVEKGGYYPRNGLSLLEGPSMQAMYEQSGALTTQDGSVILLTATTLGGGSAVNWAASLKTPAHVLDEWVGLGLQQFAEEDYRKAMEAVCRRLGVQEDCTEESFQNRVLRTGCTAMGYSVSYIPRNAGKAHDCGFCGFGCPATAAARKQSVVDTWLCDAAAAGAVVITGCHADTVLTTAQSESSKKLFRSRGICCRAGECSFYVEARATVAACGALFTPAFLKRSGLRNPHIGRHLSIHPVVAVSGYFPREDILPGRSYSGGIMTSFSNAGANWESSGYGCIMETPCVHPGNFAVLAPWKSGFDFKQRMLKYPRTASIIVLNRDRGRGTVDEQNGKLIVEYPPFSADEQSLVGGTEQALRVLLAAGAEEVGSDCMQGKVFDRRSGDSKEFEEFLKNVKLGMFHGLSTPIMSAHQMGSCRMGVDPRSSAVDLNCETWEVEGLFVGDGSVLPTASGVNPMITIQSIAYCTSKCVQRFLRS